MNESLVDCHAHLIFDNVDAKKIINGMAGVLDYIVCVSTSKMDNLKVVKLAEKEKNIYATIGIHPEYASETNPEDYKLIKKLATNKKVVAIGECGLDLHYRSDNFLKQKEVFIKQIEIAIQFKKPLMVHVRDAEEQVLEILKEYRGRLVDVIIHCYSSKNENITKAFIDLDVFFSFAGNFTFKNYRREDIKLIPINKLLVETDSPFLSPEPIRGTQNEPKNVHITVEKIAKVLEIENNKLKTILKENAKRVFRL